VNGDACGVDGRPSYSDDLATSAAILDKVLALTECPKCGHVAPNVEVAFPRLEMAKGAHAGLFALEKHDPLARRYLYVAALYGDADPREQGEWVLRAAWADEAAGRFEIARVLRGRAGHLLDEAFQEGCALAPSRGTTCLLLAEIFRLAGDFAQAALHCRRGGKLPTTNAKRMLAVVARRVIAESTAPLARAEALAEVAKMQKDELTALSSALNARCAAVPPIRLRPVRRFTAPNLAMSYRTLAAERVAFAEDFLDADLLPELLARGAAEEVWAGVLAHPALFPELLCAVNHAEPTVRATAMNALYEKTFSRKELTVRRDGFDTDALAGRADAIDAVAALLSDESAEIVRKASGVLRQVLFLDRSFAPTAADAARRVLPRWANDLSTTGVLERLIELVPSTAPAR
jgi:hypothetical protein